MIRVNDRLELVDHENENMIIRRKLYESREFVTWLLFLTGYYQIDSEDIQYINLGKDLFILICIIKMVIKLFQEIYLFVVCFGLIVNQIQEKKRL